MNKSQKSKVERKKPLLSLSVSGLLSLSLLAGVLFSSCNPDAKWETKDVDIQMSISTVSAGFVECNFSTSKEAYYLVAIEEVRENYDPMAHQKQFMMLALDSANVEYLAWRNSLLKQGEFNIAPFSSHALQYGSVNHFFTGLYPDTEYWVYAFVVNPVAMKPEGKLYLERVKTTSESIIDIHFDYRVKGRWDYIYPVDSLGNIYARFPYIATTRDSLTLAEDELYTDEAAVTYFWFWCAERFMNLTEDVNIHYGVHAVENDGYQSSEYWEAGHTYYTVISGYDGSFKQATVYKFVWTGDSCNFYLHDTDDTNLVNKYITWY